MTRPRISNKREIYGIIGKLTNASQIQKEWNEYFEKEGIDAFMSRYPTKPEELPERLSEMFHFDRRLYLVGPDLEEKVVGLLDELDISVSGKVNVIFNDIGVLKGLFIKGEPGVDDCQLQVESKLPRDFLNTREL